MVLDITLSVDGYLRCNGLFVLSSSNPNTYIDLQELVNSSSSSSGGGGGGYDGGSGAAAAAAAGSSGSYSSSSGSSSSSATPPSGSEYKYGQILELLHGECDGRSITVDSGTYQLENVSSPPII